MMIRVGVEVDLEISICGPVLVHSSSIGPWGVDAIALRDPNGRLVIPSDALQGKLRESLDSLGLNLFGRSRKEDTSLFRENDEDPLRHESSHIANLDHPASPFPVQFSALVSVDIWPAPGEQTISQTSIELQTGSSKEGSLRVFDCPVRPGEIALFKCEIRFFCEVDRGDNGEKPKDMVEKIVTALNWIPSFGSQKSIGYGRLSSPVKVTRTTIKHFNSLAKLSQSENAIVDFSFLDPLCLPLGVVNGNIYESQDEVQGEALRGAMADLLKQIGGMPAGCLDLDQAPEDHPFLKLCRSFNRIRICMARPTTPGGHDRTNVMPMSWIIARNRLFDAALIDQEELLQLFDDESGAFGHDWKPNDWKLANSQLNTIRPKQELRVRTSIDSDHRRARKGNLFAYRTLRTENVVWRTSVSIDDRAGDGLMPESERKEILEQCYALLASGWLRVGKTKSRGTGTVVASLPKTMEAEPIELNGSKVFVITLRGAALMIDPRDCVAENGCMKDAAAIDTLYAKYWTEVSGGTLRELKEHRYKQDRIIGGFQARRYRYSTDLKFDLRSLPVSERAQLQKSFPYNPTLVLKPGSVFVLEVTEPDRMPEAKANISQWMDHGLPLPEWAKKAYGDTHHTNIFLPQNGYGEIEVNLDCHRSSFLQPIAVIQEAHKDASA